MPQRGIKMGNIEKEKLNELDDDTVVGAVRVFSNETTLHGLRYLIGRGHLLIRLCWLAIVVLAFALLVMQAQIVYQDFQSSPYSTKIDIVSKVVKTFPAVTVCNDNKIRRSQLYNTKYEGLIDIDDGGRSTEGKWHNQQKCFVQNSFKNVEEFGFLDSFISLIIIILAKNTYFQSERLSHLNC